MKKSLWVLALACIVSSLFAGPVAADDSTAKQDQAFLTELSQQPAVTAAVGTECAVSAAEPSFRAAPVRKVLCTIVPCTKVSDCYAACGGPGSTYCNAATHRCMPF